MKKYIVILILILFTGCNEIINITGIFINRTVNNERASKEIILAVLNFNGKTVSNFKISILEDKDSVLIFTPLYTSKHNTTRLNFPDEQINPIKSENNNLIVIAEHPYIGTFQQTIPVTKLYESEPIIIEFNIGNVADSLQAPPSHLYKEYKY